MLRRAARIAHATSLDVMLGLDGHREALPAQPPARCCCYPEPQRHHMHAHAIAATPTSLLPFLPCRFLPFLLQPCHPHPRLAPSDTAWRCGGAHWRVRPGRQARQRNSCHLLPVQPAVPYRQEAHLRVRGAEVLCRGAAGRHSPWSPGLGAIHDSMRHGSSHPNRGAGVAPTGHSHLPAE